MVIPASEMKGRAKHIVPISKQTMQLLEQMNVINGHRVHIFPNRNDPKKPMSNNAILSLIHRMGYKGKVMVKRTISKKAQEVITKKYLHFLSTFIANNNKAGK